MTNAEYLAAEAVAEVRHEFLNGEVWAMAGGTPQHGALAEAVTDAITNPIVLVEVLSDSTEAYDRGAKWAHYRRSEGGRWELLEARPGEAIELQSLGVHLDVAAVYA
jgi:Uma2 family endonuclease